MKKIHFSKLYTLVLFAEPLFLSGFDTLKDMFGDTSSAAHYDSTRPAPVVTTINSDSSSGSRNTGASTGGSGGSSAGHIAKKKGVTATTLADPVDASVVHPKTTVTTPAAVPLAAPSVGP